MNAVQPITRTQVPAAITSTATVVPAPEQSLGARLTATLQASSDGAAIDLWLATRAEGSPHTLRAYRREALRFVLWLFDEHGKSLSEATLQDCLSYRLFMAAPAPAERWCAPRGPEVGSDAWRPFEGPLSVGARRQAVVILSNLYRFLQDQRVVHGNPWGAVRTPRHAAPRVDVSRSLTVSQWSAVQAAADQPGLCANDHDARQLRWVLRFLFSSGLRRSEMTAAKVGHLRWVELNAVDAAQEALRGGWVVEVVGKGQRQRLVPLPDKLVDEFFELMALRGWPGGLQAHGNKPLLVAWSGFKRDESAQPAAAVQAMSDRGLGRKLKQVFVVAAHSLADRGRQQDADAVQRASVHWLRHTHGTRSLEAGVPLDVVQANLGHASLATTTVYVVAQMDRRLRETGRLVRGFVP